VEVNASAVVAAIGAYSRINSAGQWVERSERIDLNQLFDRMSASELEEYARNGRLPDWFSLNSWHKGVEVGLLRKGAIGATGTRLAPVAIVGTSMALKPTQRV
jgi:hypothetical protein